MKKKKKKNKKLFCGIYSTFKCSFDEFVGEKVFSPSYSSAILAPPPLVLSFMKTTSAVEVRIDSKVGNGGWGEISEKTTVGGQAGDESHPD